MNALVQNSLMVPAGLDLGGGISLLEQHDCYYSTSLADSPALLDAAHALRFQVYCLERQFENAEEHPDGLERDAYDSHSVHGVVFHRPTGGAIGTARMIMPVVGKQDCFPIMTLLAGSSLDLSDYVDIDQCIEVSRFAISKEFRRRKADQLAASTISRAEAGREINLAFLSLLQFVLRESVRRDIFYWTAVMEPKFLRLLARMGICYTPLGPLVMHHGLRQPCFCYVPAMLDNARRHHPEYWNVLTDGGVLHEALLTKAGIGDPFISPLGSLAAE